MASPAQHGSGTESSSYAGVVGPLLVSGHCPSCSFVSKANAGEGGLECGLEWDRASR